MHIYTLYVYIYIRGAGQMHAQPLDQLGAGVRENWGLQFGAASRSIVDLEAR